MVQSVPKDAVEQSYYGKIMIGPHWGSVERLEVAGFNFCTLIYFLHPYFNTAISQLCFELEQIRDHFSIPPWGGPKSKSGLRFALTQSIAEILQY